MQKLGTLLAVKVHCPGTPGDVIPSDFQ